MPNYNYGVNELQTWRSRYSKIEYPEKLMINHFYMQHSVNFMWDFLHSAFEKNLLGKRKTSFNDFDTARSKISEVFKSTKLEKTHSALPNLISKKINVGGLYFDKINKLVQDAKVRNNSSIEELEFSYLYFTLANENVFRWSACGMIGKSKQDAFQAVTGVVINTDLMTNYESTLNHIGPWGAGKFLERNYIQLPSLF